MILAVRPAPAAQASSAITMVLVLDRSGSMRRTDPQALSLLAARFVADHLDEKDQLVLLPFSSQVQEPTRVDGWDRAARGALQARLDALPPRGDTDITGSLEAALKLATGSTTGRPVVLLLTDGANDPPPGASRYQRPESDYRSADARTQARLRAAEANRVLLEEIVPPVAAQPQPPILALGFGEHDKPLMQELAQRSSGAFFFARSSRELPGICDDVLRSLKDVYKVRSQPVARPGEQELTLSLDPFVARATVRLIHPVQDAGSRLASIRDPAGRIVFAAGREPEGAVRHGAGRNYDLVHIPAPAPGTWRITLQAGDYALDDEQDRRLELLVERRRLSIASDLDRRQLFWPLWAPLPVLAEVRDGASTVRTGDLIEGWRVDIKSFAVAVAGPGSSTEEPLAGPDARGAFAGRFRAPALEGSYHVKLAARLAATPVVGGAPIEFDLQKPPRAIEFEEFPRGVIRAEPSQLLAGQRSLVKALLQRRGQRWTPAESGQGGSVAMSVALSAGQSAPVALADDGRGFDETASDGIFSGEVSAALAPGPHTLSLVTRYRGQDYTAARATLTVHAPTSISLEIAASPFHTEAGHHLAGETVDIKARLTKEGRAYDDTALAVRGELRIPGTDRAVPLAFAPVPGQPGTYGARAVLAGGAGRAIVSCSATGGPVRIPDGATDLDVEVAAPALHPSSRQGVVGTAIALAAGSGSWASRLTYALSATRDGQPYPLRSPALVDAGGGRFSFTPAEPGVYVFRAAVADPKGIAPAVSEPIDVKARFDFALRVRPADALAGVTVGEPLRLELSDTAGGPHSVEATADATQVALCSYRASARRPPRVEVDGPSGNFHFHERDVAGGKMMLAAFTAPGLHQIRVRPDGDGELVRTEEFLVDVRLPALEVAVDGTQATTATCFDLGKLGFFSRRVERTVRLRSESFPADTVALDLREVRGAEGLLSGGRVAFTPVSSRCTLSATGQVEASLPISVSASSLVRWGHYEVRCGLRGLDRDHPGLTRGQERTVTLRFEGPFPLVPYALALGGLLLLFALGRWWYEEAYLERGDAYTVRRSFRIGSRADCDLSYPGLHEVHVVFSDTDDGLGVATDGSAEAYLDGAPLDATPRRLVEGVTLRAGQGWFTMRFEKDEATGVDAWRIAVARDYRASVPLKLVVLWWMTFLGWTGYCVLRALQYLRT